MVSVDSVFPQRASHLPCKRAARKFMISTRSYALVPSPRKAKGVVRGEQSTCDQLPSWDLKA